MGERRPVHPELGLGAGPRERAGVRQAPGRGRGRFAPGRERMMFAHEAKTGERRGPACPPQESHDAAWTRNFGQLPVFPSKATTVSSACHMF